MPPITFDENAIDRAWQTVLPGLRRNHPPSPAVEEIKEIFRLNDVHAVSVQDIGGDILHIHITAPQGVPFWKVARKIENCFCRDFTIERITLIDKQRGYEIVLTKTDLLPTDQQ